MAAATFTSAQATRRLTMENADVLQTVTFTTGTVGAVVRPIGGAGKSTNTGAQGDAIGSDYRILDADTPVVIPFTRAAYGSPPVLRLTHASNGGTIEVTPIPGGT